MSDPGVIEESPARRKDAVARGDYGHVLVIDEVYNYVADDWFCYCADLGCDAACGPGAACGECCCGEKSICEALDGDGRFEINRDALSTIGDDTAPALTELPTGPCVYLVQMMPDVAPRRLKLGYSANVASRVGSYRTACPDARVIAARAGDMGLEHAMLTAFGRAFRNIGGEVFEVNAVGEALRRFVEVKSS